MDLAIETLNLTKTYGSLTAVNKLNLKVKRNTIHGFLGPNGAGKTTTIKILVGLLKPNEGIVKILGHQVKGDQADTRLSIGYMPELPKFPKHLKGAELLDIYGQMYGMTKQERRTQISKLIELVGLKGRENDPIGKYSKGMQQRIGIAQALLNDPELVILDEPSLGLDPVGMIEVRELVKAIAKENRTVFISSHLLFEVEQICTHVTIINRGKALITDTLQNVLNTLSGPTTLQVEVTEPSEAVIMAVQNLPFVSKVTQNSNLLNIDLKTYDDVRPQVSQTITNAGGIIISMNIQRQNLESAFMTLVNKHQGGEN